MKREGGVKPFCVGRVSLLAASAAIMLGSAAYAEPLVINPFPQPEAGADEVAGEGAAAPSVTAEPVIVPDKDVSEGQIAATEKVPSGPVAVITPVPAPSQENLRSALPAGVKVPEPGSSYFDPPSVRRAQPEPDVAAVVEAEPPATSIPAASAPVEASGAPRALAASEATLEPMAETAPVSQSGGGLSVTLKDIGEEPVAPDASIKVEKSQKIDLLAEAPDRGYVPQDAEIGRIPEAPSAPAAGVEVAGEQPVNTEEALEVGLAEAAKPPAVDQVPMNDEGAVADVPVIEAPAEGLVYIRDGKILSAPGQTAADAGVEEIQPTSGGERWEAVAGASIRQTLDEWSRKAGVALVWEDRNEFAVLQPFEVTGSYEQAVTALLDQYLDDQVRPLAKLHNDPALGGRVLVVEVQNGL